MNFHYSPQTIAQGRDNQQRANDQPNTFGTANSADDYQQTSFLDKPKQRMAGRIGQRALDYMQDPTERARTDKWMKYFGMSNEGAIFNQAKMNGGVIPMDKLNGTSKNGGESSGSSEVAVQG